MKATGIVRRIDDLGRVVIPKEIRRTMRIRDGDPLEIYTDKNGEVIFKKYSLMGGLGDFSTQVCDALSKSTNRIAVVTDRDACIAVAGGGRRDLGDKQVSGQLERIMENRQLYQRRDGDPALAICEGGERYHIDTAAPILCEGDVLGCILFVGTEEDAPPTDVEAKLAQTMAGFLGRHMES